MIEFLQKHWWLILCLLIPLAPVLYNEITLHKQSDADEYKNGILSGSLLLAIFIVPQFYFSELEDRYTEALVSALYIFYIGLLFVLSYYHAKKNYFLRMISAFGKFFLTIKSDKRNLYFGASLIAISPIVLVLK